MLATPQFAKAKTGPNMKERKIGMKRGGTVKILPFLHYHSLRTRLYESIHNLKVETVFVMGPKTVDDDTMFKIV